MSEVAQAVAAIRSGGLAVIPTDTVYGLACAADREAPVRTLAELKRRPRGQPIALVAASVERLLELLPELRGSSGALAKRLLPGPYTLVLSNPAGRFSWLTGDREGTIGIRVPALTGPGRDVLDQLGAVAATSANLHGEPDPRRLDEVPSAILAAVAATVDGGELPGAPSTVIDLTGPEPRVLRVGAVSAEAALARLARSPAE